MLSESLDNDAKLIIMDANYRANGKTEVFVSKRRQNDEVMFQHADTSVSDDSEIGPLKCYTIFRLKDKKKIVLIV